MKKYLSILALTVGISFVAATPAAAQLIVYEGFDYAAASPVTTNIAGQNGGTGWTTAWAAGSGNIYGSITNGSLSYGALQTSGNSLISGNIYGNIANTTASPNRSLPNTFSNLLSGADGQIWISFIYLNLQASTYGAPGYRQANMGLFATSAERLAVGSLNTYQNPNDYMSMWGQGIGHPAAQQSGTATPRGITATPVFVLLRLDIVNSMPSLDTAYAWFNPTIGGSAPSTATAISTNIIDLSLVNNIRFQAGNLNTGGSNTVFMVDELRVGYTFADVTPVPEPMTIALGSLGGLLLLALRRRK
jgi:hypothetical protein